MAKVRVAAFVAGAGASSKSGITLALAESKAGQYIRIGLSAAAQTEYFGGVLNPEKDALELILDDEPGSVHVMALRRASIEDESAMQLTGGIKGSISLKVVPWRKVAPGKRPGVSLVVLNRQAGKLVSVRLPDWAKPEPRKIGQGRSIME